MPWQEGRKRPYSELTDPYAGPEEFMEAGVRGFLVTSIPNREEHAVDQALKILRKASVKLYGGITPGKNSDASFATGYIAVDFMEPETVHFLPNPNVDAEEAEQDQQESKEKETEGDQTEATQQSEENKEMGKTEEKMETKNKDSDEKQDEGKEEEEKEAEVGASDNKDVDEKMDESEEGEEKVEGDESVTAEKENEAEAGKDDKSKDESCRSKSSDGGDKKNKDGKKKSKEEERTHKYPLMKTHHKFEAFRTELRNIMFIKSDVPNPKDLVCEIMDLIIAKQPLKGDCVSRLLPIHGVCNFDFWELEIMSKRVLAPFFPEDVEEAPSFGILLFDKLSEPGSDSLVEIVRSAIWSMNPLAWQGNPLTEPDIAIHLELIGSKIVLGAMPNFMRYRQYSPFYLAELGPGQPEDEGEPERKHSNKGSSDTRGDRKGRNESHSRRSQKDSKNIDKKSGAKNKSNDKDKGESKAEKSHESKPFPTERDDSVRSKKQKTDENEKEVKEESVEESVTEEIATEETATGEEASEKVKKEKKSPSKKSGQGRRSSSKQKKSE